MDLLDFCSRLDSLFELDSGTVATSDSLQKIPGWDSLTFMGLIAMVDEEYGVTLRPTDVLRAASVADLANLISVDSEDRSSAA